MPVYRLGDTGPAVAEVRSRLAMIGLLPDREVGRPGFLYDGGCSEAVRAFQQQRGLSVDGAVGDETYRALDEARWRLGDRLLSLTAGRWMRGDDVADLQRRLLDMGFDPGRADGIFGPWTDAAVREFQRNVAVPADGVCGPETLRALAMLVRTVKGGSPEELRESERIHQAGPRLGGRLVVVDPGHGGADRGGRNGCLDEASIVEDLAARLEGRLAATGVQVFATRGPGGSPDDEARAAFANTVGADLLISLHVDAAPSQDCQGVATFYYGTPPDPRTGRSSTSSGVGERFASLVQRELVARTGLLDCRSHPKTWSLMRLTRMPAVRIELGYLSNPTDREKLASPDFRDVVSEGVVAAVQRLYLPADDDAQTGQLRIPAFL